MKNTLFRTTFVTIASFVVVITVVSAWTAPTAAPPSGNVSAPVNVSGTSQVKSGGLGVGSFNVTAGSQFNGTVNIGSLGTSKQVCLNGACITAWPNGGGVGDNLGNHIALQNLNMNNRAITNLPLPVNGGDATNKTYVDGRVSNISITNYNQLPSGAVAGYCAEIGGINPMPPPTRAPATKRRGVYCECPSGWARIMTGHERGGAAEDSYEHSYYSCIKN